MEININRRCRRYSDLASVRYEHFTVVLSRDNGTKWMTAYHTGQIKGNCRFRRYTEPEVKLKASADLGGGYTEPAHIT